MHRNAGMIVLAVLCINLVLISAEGEDNCVLRTISNTLSKTDCSTITTYDRDNAARKLVLCVLKRLESVPLCTMDEYLKCTPEISDMMSQLHDVARLGFYWICLCGERHKIHTLLPKVSRDISVALSSVNQDGYGLHASAFSATDSYVVGAGLKSLRHSGTVEARINMLSRSIAETFARTNASFQSHEAAQEQAWAFVRIVIDQMQNVSLRMRKVWNKAFEKAFYSRAISHVFSAHFSMLFLSVLLPPTSFSRFVRVLHIVILVVNIVIGKPLWSLRLAAYLLSSILVLYSKHGRTPRSDQQEASHERKNQTKSFRWPNEHESLYFPEDSGRSSSHGSFSFSEYASIQLEDSCECCKDDELFAR